MDGITAFDPSRLWLRAGVIDLAGCSRRDLNTLEAMELLRLSGSPLSVAGSPRFSIV